MVDDSTTKSGPPMMGHAVQYERLWLEEVALENERRKILQSSSTDQQQCENYEFRSMIHRASLDGLLISAQFAARKVKLDANNSSRYNFERGLDEPDAVNALSALRDMKMRQLESDNNKVPVSVSSSSAAARWKNNTTLETNCKQAATADSFFAAFPECKRRVHEESDDDDNDDDGTVQKPKSARIETKDKCLSPILVSSSSNSPSSNPPDDEVQIITKHQQQPINKRGPSNQQQRNHLQKNHNSISIPNKKYHSNKAQNIIKNCPPPQHNNHNINPYRNQPANKFDYNDTSSAYDEQQAMQSNAKMNPFRTAKEVGPQFDNKKLQQGRKGNNNWDEYESSNNTSAYPCNNRMGRRPAQSSAGPSGPQQMVRTAIRGPTNNLSAGLKRKFQPPMKREGGGPAQPNQGRNQNSNHNNNATTKSSSSKSSDGNDEEELPEELRGLDKELIEKINNDIVDNGQRVTFKDIAGLENAKNTVNELVIFPMKRPDLFTGLRACPKGLLLFGPPGTGTLTTLQYSLYRPSL